MLRLSTLSLAFLVIIPFTGCIKSLEREKFEFSFTYDGRTYTNPDDGYVDVSGGVVHGIEIRKHDVLSGIIRFSWSNNCAFLEPTGTLISFNYNFCEMTTSGNVDTSRIFRYSSGSGNYNFTTCKEKKWLDGTIYHECTVIGSFSLVLVNDVGETKTITGTFKDPAVIN
jgi:hypothetical protein